MRYHCKYILKQFQKLRFVLEQSGAFGIVLECIYSDISKQITNSINIPTIGIGASVNCDGQVLVTDDLIGLNETNFRFVKKFGDIKKYLVKLSNQILVQENDFIKAGMPLSDGSITPVDILNIKGPSAVQQYLVNEVQEVYRLQGVKINDKHFEVVVRQMMRKVKIQDSGDTIFLQDQLVHKSDFIDENDSIYGKKIVEEVGSSDNLNPGQMISARQLRDENSLLEYLKSS